MPRATGLLNRFRDGEDQFVLKWPADNLDADGQSFIRNADGNGCAGKAGQVQPLRKPHGVAVAGPAMVISLAVTKRGAGGNRGEQHGRVLHLAQNIGTEKIPIRAGFGELIQCNWMSRGRVSEILAKHRADFIFVAGDTVPEQIADYRAKEKPPQIERAIEAIQMEGFDGEAALGE